MPLAPRTNFKIGYARKFGRYIYRKTRKILDRRFFLFFSFLFFFSFNKCFSSFSILYLTELLKKANSINTVQLRLIIDHL